MIGGKMKSLCIDYYLEEVEDCFFIENVFVGDNEELFINDTMRKEGNFKRLLWLKTLIAK